MSGKSEASENERRFFAAMRAYARREFPDSARRELAMRVLADPSASERAKSLARRILTLSDRAEEVDKFLNRKPEADD